MTPHLRSLVKESAEATTSLLGIGPDATVDQLKHACRELQEAEDSVTRAKRDLQSEIDRSIGVPAA